MQGQKAELFREIDKIIRFDTDIVYPIEKSFVIGVIIEDSTYVLNFGPEHIDSFDLFEIGGITKVFTSTLASQLDLKNLIKLDTTINSFLPEKYQNKYLEDYTLEDLMMHKIGFPKRPSNLSSKEYNFSNPYAYYTKEDVLYYYANFKPQKANWFRPSLKYSHINYALLEIILEAKMNMPLEDLFHFYLFQDLKLYNTSLAMPDQKLKIGYDRSNMIPEPWSYQSFAGSEGLVSCLNDLIKFTKQSMDDRTESLVEAQKVRKNSKINNKLSLTYAWYILNSKQTGRIFTHSGTTERHKAYIHYKKESRTGVIILCQSSEGVGELGMLILRMINNNWN
ncbi:hypothetical protein GCM10007940_29070 [Portibacter lacus]|uniref:Beta-lactamase-related domain-containing protein n=1 Tax=Portibacter lacus TaxID=1099794 RepID=A0AA37ST65_9BACT|nr:hypothetical protein GCM10007940_29070 [Portibacter lacus]